MRSLMVLLGLLIVLMVFLATGTILRQHDHVEAQQSAVERSLHSTVQNINAVHTAMATNFLLLPQAAAYSGQRELQPVLFTTALPVARIVAVNDEVQVALVDAQGGIFKPSPTAPTGRYMDYTLLALDQTSGYYRAYDAKTLRYTTGTINPQTLADNIFHTSNAAVQVADRNASRVLKISVSGILASQGVLHAPGMPKIDGRSLVAYTRGRTHWVATGLPAGTVTFYDRDGHRLPLLERRKTFSWTSSFGFNQSPSPTSIEFVTTVNDPKLDAKIAALYGGSASITYPGFSATLHFQQNVLHN